MKTSYSLSFISFYFQFLSTISHYIRREKSIMKTSKYTFYIGQNNDTKKPEINKAIARLNKEKIKGFSVSKSIIGLWENSQEKSFKIEIINTSDNPIRENQAIAIRHILEAEA